MKSAEKIVCPFFPTIDFDDLEGAYACCGCKGGCQFGDNVLRPVQRNLIDRLEAESL